MRTEREAIRECYASAAGTSCDPMMAGGGSAGCSYYDAEQLEGLPAGITEASLGCANPVALADLHEGEVVLDLGSGAGLDVLLSARRVGPAGKAYGLDMTDEMLALARANQRAASVDNVEFLKGVIEDVPLPSESVDVVLSNCVVNLSTDKESAFAEMFRVLRAGGRLAIADVIDEGVLSDPERSATVAGSPCLGMTLTAVSYVESLTRAGFAGVAVEPLREVCRGFASAFVRAEKPPAISGTQGSR